MRNKRQRGGYHDITLKNKMRQLTEVMLVRRCEKQREDTVVNGSFTPVINSLWLTLSGIMLFVRYVCQIYSDGDMKSITSAFLLILLVSALGCLQGFDGPSCTETYRSGTTARFTGQPINLVSIPFGSANSVPVVWIQFHIVIDQMPSSTIELLNLTGDGTNIHTNLFLVTLDPSGIVNIRSSCGAAGENGTLSSTVGIPLQQWTSVVIRIDGSQNGQYCHSTSIGTISFDGNLVGTSSLYAPLIRASGRLSNLLGNGFFGRISFFSTSMSDTSAVTPSCGQSVLLCDFSLTSNTTCTTDTIALDTADPTRFLQSYSFSLYAWTLSAGNWVLPIYSSQNRDALVQSIVARGIKNVHLNNNAPQAPPNTCWADTATSRWELTSLSKLMKSLHQAGVTVYALYTDPSLLNDVIIHNMRATLGAHVNGSIPLQPFDGISMDYEPPTFDTTNKLALMNVLNKTVGVCRNLSIACHVSMSYRTAFYNGTGDYASTPFYQQILDLLQEGDSVDIQTGSSSPCNVQSRMRPVITYANTKKVSTFIHLETRNDTDVETQGFSFFGRGESQMWSTVRRMYHDGDAAPTGFVLHQWRQSINTGMSLWPNVGFDGDCGNDCAPLGGVCGDGVCDPIVGETVGNCGDCLPVGHTPCPTYGVPNEVSGTPLVYYQETTSSTRSTSTPATAVDTVIQTRLTNIFLNGREALVPAVMTLVCMMWFTL
ncbi:hypothetical protein PROFUN_09910 [Planoprotostelium fungivorum]|uniref:Uncharacterized protein n=1 Tax=Planoprotostelium fungivorum TaxID=1890364 RepID=A0A2P6NGH6_9EUKA|nr:hypothetical protein PROFUN_09910 [Planoprotostelium fungivorum]